MERCGIRGQSARLLWGEGFREAADLESAGHGGRHGGGRIRKYSRRGGLRCREAMCGCRVKEWQQGAAGWAVAGEAMRVAFVSGLTAEVESEDQRGD